jgi:hypothetical protein
VTVGLNSGLSVESQIRELRGMNEWLTHLVSQNQTASIAKHPQVHRESYLNLLEPLQVQKVNDCLVAGKLTLYDYKQHELHSS